MNVYGPCHQREHFWQHFFNLSILDTDHIIISGDLNFSLGFRESWGSTTQMDAISGYMTNLLEQTYFVDVPMHKPQPTWRNRMVGEAALACRLDRFLMKSPLIQHLHHYKQWVGTRGLSDHSHIYLKILGPHHKPKAPFKFNHVWLQDPKYISLVTGFWSTNPINREESLMKCFCNSLSKLKHLSITWAREKLIRENSQLTQIESKMSTLLDERSLGFNSAADKAHLIELEKQKAHILKEREESLRLRSRAIWLKAGDDNTKFYQNYAKGRKVSNTIWKLPLPKGGFADCFNKLSHLEAEELYAPVTSGELEGALKWFKKDKSPGLDGWTIKFYLAFYEILGHDLLKVVEESRTTGTLYHAINSTFIALIPKTDSPSSFDDYRPISLCNFLYKIISKIIANRLRLILSRHIAPQQFAFLDSRQIHEAIGSAQQAIHSIWTRQLKGIILKIDLSKAFDRVSWLYIKMLLIHLGFPLNYITWTMAYITTPTFSVLINGSTSHFFHSERGLGQGCPLSPILFFIVMEGLNRLIASAKSAGDLCGLKISDDCFLNHLLFVDDVLILLDGSIRDSLTFSKILLLFLSASGMLANQSKSTITFARTFVHESHFSH
eukprot:PITA_24332